MGSLGDIVVSAGCNILTTFAFLLAFALFRIQPINDRVYFSKWYIVGQRNSPKHAGSFMGRFASLDSTVYKSFFSWMPQALKMNEAEIISHAGLDSAIFLRAFTLGLKIFVPATALALMILVPVNSSHGTLSALSKELVVSNIDKLSISNVPSKSMKLFIHIGMEFLLTFWTCFLLYKEYGTISKMRLRFLASQGRRAEQFTVLVRNIPHVSGRSISDTVDMFFRKNHEEHYLCHQAVYDANSFRKLVEKRNRLQRWLDYYQLKFERNPDKKSTVKKGFLGLWGKKVDAIDYYRHQLKELDKKMTVERERILKDPKHVMNAAFVSFNSRWGAAVCSQTQQTRNPTCWLPRWAPEPHDIYWKNLAIPFLSIGIRRFVISAAVFALVFFYMIPIAFVQSLANLDGLERVAPFLRPVMELEFIKSFLQGFLPGLALKIFLLIVPSLLMMMSKVEGYVAISTLERRAAGKYYIFMLVNVFFGSIIAGTAFEQLDAFLHQSAAQVPRNIGVSIPMKATFFITFILIDGLAGVAGEILRLKPLVIFHLKNMFIVKTERDREKAMDPGSVNLPETLPTLELYFLLGLVYAVVTPILLPFLLVFFGFAYVVYRHQIINVYNQQYESAGAFWPHIHGHIIGSLLISQFLLFGLLSTKKAVRSIPLIVLLPILTYAFHRYCKSRFEPAFRMYPLEEAKDKDTEDKATESDVSLKSFLADAYLHPIFHSFEQVESVEVRVDKNQAQIPCPEAASSSSSDVHEDEEPFSSSHNVVHQHYEYGPPGDVFNYEAPEHSSNVFEYGAEPHDHGYRY